MKKLAVILGAAVVLYSGSASAVVACYEPGCNQTQNQTQSQNQNQTQTLSNTNNNNNNNTSTNNNVSNSNSTAYGGAGGSATAYGGNAKSQATGGNASANNSLTVNYEEKRELPNIPSQAIGPQLEYRGPYQFIFPFVSPWNLISVWKPAMLENFPDCGWKSCQAKTGVIASIEKKDIFTVVPKSNLFYLGTIIIFATNPLELWKKVAETAFEVGADEVQEIAFKSTFTNESSGWNIGLGGGVSMISNGNDNIGGSVGGGTGFGSVETRPVEKAHAAFNFYIRPFHGKQVTTEYR
jgi:hypothetical protein